MKYDIMAIGEILCDLVPNGYDSNSDAVFVRKAGGAPLNLLAAASHFGCRTLFAGKVGDDIMGRFLIDSAKRCKIDTSSIITDSMHNTTLAIVELNKNGERDFSFFRRNGADIFLSADEVNLSAVANSQIFHFGSLSLTDEPSYSATFAALKAAKANGVIISYDPNYRAALWQSTDTAIERMRKGLMYADIVKLGLNEAMLITGKSDVSSAMDELILSGAKIILITDGENGTNAYVNGETFTVSAYKVKAVDTTGAGDIFFGTFLSCLVHSKKAVSDITLCKATQFIKKASYVAAISTQSYGAIASIPNITTTELDKMFC